VGKPKVYIDACCFIEMACHKVGTHKKVREDDIAFLHQIVQAAYAGEIEVYTSILSVAECQCAYDDAQKARIMTDEVKKLFKDLLTSGQFVILVQDSVLVAERARNLSWVHQLTFSGADAVHVASALEMSCDELLTFDDKMHSKSKELEELGITVRFPKETQSLAKKAADKARLENIGNDQGTLLLGLENDAEQAPIGRSEIDSSEADAKPAHEEKLVEAITGGQPQASSAAVAEGNTIASPLPTPISTIIEPEQLASGEQEEKLGQQASPPATEPSVSRTESEPPTSTER